MDGSSRWPCVKNHKMSKVTLPHEHSMADVKISIDEQGLITQVTENVEKDQEKKDFRKFIICALGIFVCHFILGILQESM